MSVIESPKEEFEDDFDKAYWALANPNRKDIKPVRVVHNEMSAPVLTDEYIENMELNMFIPEKVAKYLGYDLDSCPKWEVIAPNGEKLVVTELKSMLFKWLGNEEEQKARKSYSGLYSDREIKENKAYVWPYKAQTGTYLRIKQVE